MLKTKSNLLKVSLVILMIASSIILLTGCGKKDNKENNNNNELAYLQPLKDYFDGIKNRDVAQVVKAFPDFMGMENTITTDDINDLYTQYEELYGANINIDYAFGEATAIGEEELVELEEEITELYENVENIDITAGYTVPVTVTITGDGIKNAESTEGDSSENNEESETSDNVEQDEMYVLQYNGNWYIM